jgi:unsaturated rhamnogalacturonyl hydrolase
MTMRRLLVRSLAGVAVGATLVATVTVARAASAPAPDDASMAAIGAPGTDWSSAVIDSTMKSKSPTQLGAWSYPQGLYLYGQYLAFQRTHNQKYLTYIKAWADRFVDSKGNISNGFNSLDSMQSGNVLLILFKETKDARYKTAAMKIRNRLKTYPRTKDGGFWHATSRQHQLWGDGVFMVLPFLVHYGQIVGEASTLDDEAANQLLIYDKHLLAPNGMHFHAYDEAAAQPWVVPGTNHAPEEWCRANGWYTMALAEVLEFLPASNAKRPQLIAIMKRMVQGIKALQDAKSGLWFQVADKGNKSDNWTETSCSSMFTYTVSRAVQRGYVDASFKSVATKGYQAILTSRVSKDSSGMTNISQICIGTNVGDYPFYIARPRATNDLHGLGSFLIMNEQLQFSGA